MTSLVPPPRPSSAPRSVVESAISTAADDAEERTIRSTDDYTRQSKLVENFGNEPKIPASDTLPRASIEDIAKVESKGVYGATGDDDFPEGGLRAWLVVLGVSHF